MAVQEPRSFPSRQSLREQQDTVKSPRQPLDTGQRGALRGRRTANASVVLPWWITHWVLLTAVAAVVILGGLLTFTARDYWESQRPPVLVVDGVLDEVVVSGRPGAAPVVSVLSPVIVNEVESRQQVLGTGREVEENTPILLSVSSFDPETGANLNADTPTQLVVGLANEDDLGSTLANIVIGSTEGSRFVVARPLSDGSTEVNVVDVMHSIAKGSEVDGGTSPLEVTLGEAGPVITHEDEDPPSDVTVQILIQGDGAQVHAGDQVVAQYLAINWSTMDEVASTWDEGQPRLIELSDAMPGLRDALVDQKVGTRLAITIPPDLATGEDTLCVVVDILGTMPSDNADSGQS